MVRFYYDKDFLIKNTLFKKRIGIISLCGYNWLNFLLKDVEKNKGFVLGAKDANTFLENFDGDEYKNEYSKM